MILDYSAACGLLGGLRAKSLKDEYLDQLNEKSFSSLKDFLKDYLEEDYPEVDDILHLEKALYISLIKKTGKILRFLGRSPRESLKVFLWEFDLLNLRLLIRIIKFGLEASQYSDMFYWGYPYLIFKDKNPLAFKEFGDLEKFLKKEPPLKKIFTKALRDLDFYKDIFYFDICLDREYLQLLKNLSLRLDKKSSLLTQYFIAIKSIIYALRLKFFQKRDSAQIQSFVWSLPLFNEKIFSEIMNVSSLENALSILEKSPLFLKFKAEVSLDFEKDMEDIFYRNFLEKRSIDFFTLHPYLSFYLKQRYLIEKMIFIMNSNKEL